MSSSEIVFIKEDIELYRKARIDLAQKRPKDWRHDSDSLFIEIQLLKYRLECLAKQRRWRMPLRGQNQKNRADDSARQEKEGAMDV